VNADLKLDSVDRRILELLQNDGGLSVSEVAERLGMTPPPCWRRIRRLKEERFLYRRVWLVDPATVGLGVTIYANIQLATHDKAATTNFREKVQTYPEVQECYILLGAIDVLVKIVVVDIKAYEEFFYNHLSQLPGVREVTSNVVLTQVKATTALPIERV
jgi:Lrp/AsnC family transcriptional regulator